MKIINWNEAEEFLKSGKIGVIPTDTLYGMSASIRFPESIEKIYEIKKRNPKKPLIILISSFNDLDYFGVNLSDSKKEILKKIWPGKVSVILKCPNDNLSFLHRNKNSLAFRLPAKNDLISLLEKTGPLVSTTVNEEGKNPAENFSEAEKTFGEKLDFFIDEGELVGSSSTLLDFSENELEVLRKGDNFRQLERLLF